MRRILLGHDREVANWVSDRLGGKDDFGDGAVSIGVADETGLIAGIVFNNYTRSSISIHVAATDKHWMSKDLLRLTFAYPFKQLKVNRVTGLVRVDNPEAIKFNKRLGFKPEGVVRCGDDDGTDLILMGMLPSECRWLEI